ncbi:methylase [Trypanosoma grayi]|uniref:methylase n=1 Tax=Trypanosoma grayi TaxID=71804 RepID=UPI0004F41FE9|nr:methylase [Trypanosoma grayi]KEG13373.1 methylase [Trypanosoma grayi]
MLVEKPNYESCNYNSDPIGDVLEGLLRAKRLGSSVGGGVEVLELASGSGQHAVYMTRRFPPSFIARWVCTDLPEMLPGICRWLQEDGKQHAALVQQPHALSFTDTESRWIEIRQLACTSTSNTVNGTAREIGYDLVFTSNSLHIAPWEACCVLFRRLPLVVRPGGMFIVYGAFNYNGTFTTESNRRFDARLKQSHPWCGIREKEAVESLLAQQGFTLEEDYAMPDNNRCLCFRRREGTVC